jgi:hypothetical protein
MEIIAKERMSMAGDWIKVDITTPDKPEVHLIAEHLGIDPDAVTGKLIRIWCWADQQTVDGNARSVTKTLLDRVSGVTGFSEMLVQVGWLEESTSGFCFPNFDRHNGQTAKNRALTGKRVQKSRNAASVTKTLPEIEKRREENNIETQDATASSGPVVAKSDAASVNALKKRPATFGKPTVQDVIEYVLEIGSTVDAKSFWDYYESNGWRVGRNPMKDWRATVRQWQSRNQQGNYSNGKPQQRKTSAEQREELNANSFDWIRQAASEAAGGGCEGLSVPSGTGATLFLEEHRAADGTRC